MAGPVIEFADGNVFAYLSVHHTIVIWVRENGAWMSGDRWSNASDDDVREGMDAQAVEVSLGDGRFSRTLHGGAATGDMVTWTLVTGPVPSRAAADNYLNTKES